MVNCEDIKGEWRPDPDAESAHTKINTPDFMGSDDSHGETCYV